MSQCLLHILYLPVHMDSSDVALIIHVRLHLRGLLDLMDGAALVPDDPPDEGLRKALFEIHNGDALSQIPLRWDGAVLSHSPLSALFQVLLLEDFLHNVPATLFE